MDDKGITEAGFDPDTIAECKYMRNYYSHWAYKVAEPLMYALTVVLPLMYLELQNFPFFGVTLITCSILVFIIRTYKTVDHGSLRYVFIDDLHCKPGDLKVEVYELKKQAKHSNPN